MTRTTTTTTPGRTGPGRRARRPSAQRRRAALLAAAVEIAGEQGPAAVTHRAVAARAGVPLATTSYFFASITELLAEALRDYGRRRATELDEAAAELSATVGSEPEIAERFAEALLQGDRTRELAEIEAMLHAARSPELQEAMHEVVAAYERVAAAALRAVGAPDPEAAAPAFKALCDGFVLGHLARPRPDDVANLSQALQALLDGYRDPRLSQPGSDATRDSETGR